MRVHGQSDFYVVARPVLFVEEYTNASVSVLYDTFSTFTEGPVLYNYTVGGGVLYTSRNSPDSGIPLVKWVSLDSAVTPPINAIVSALSEATAVSSISTNNGSAIECSSGKTFRISVNGIDFGLYASGSLGFMMYGSDMDIAVEYLESHAIMAPKVVDNTATRCDAMALALASPVSSIGKSLLSGKSISTNFTRKLEAAFDFSLDDSCSCKATPRPCIFIHGKEEPQNADELPKYWGDLTDCAPCCTSMKYAVLNTINNSWTDEIQQQKVCDRALAVSKTSTKKTISDTIIMTHSMGGLMMADALATGKCRLAPSSTWVSSAAPMTGGMSSDYFQNSCKDDTNFVMETFMDFTGLCSADDGIQSLAYEGESYSSMELDAAYAAAQEAYRTNVSALMCSNSYAGTYSIEYLQYWTLGNMVPHKSDKNDGMVEFQSCAPGISESEFGNTYRDKFYATKLNHADAAFRHGDSLLDEAKMPVKWFECLL